MSQRRRSLVVGVYAWMAAVAVGLVLMDVSYAANVSATQVAGALDEMRDLLSTFGGMTIVVGIGAVASAWPSVSARYVLLVSLVLMTAEMLAPALISQAVRDAESASGIRIGPWLRVGLSASASAFAFAGFWLSRQAQGTD